MKFFLIIFLLSSFLEAYSQPFLGKWTGTVQGSNGSLDSEMNLKYNASKTQILGEMIVTNGGARDYYALNATVNQSSAKGTLKYKDGTVFMLEMTIAGESLTQKFHTITN